MEKSLEQMLKSEQGESLKNFIKKKKKELEKNYSKKECVKDDFLFTMLSKGYINEEYRYYIERPCDDNVFSIWDRHYINIVKDGLDPHFDIKLYKKEDVIKKIRDYQWSSPSVLNYDVLTYLIQQRLTEKINWFIDAIQYYDERYQKNDFIEKYLRSIDDNPDKSEIKHGFVSELFKKLNTDISLETKNKILLSIFSEQSAALFCELLGEQNDENADLTKLWSTFFKSRKSILEYIVSNSEQDTSLKNILTKINVEVEKISDYNSDVQGLLVKNGMFRITKNNLDYIIAQWGDVQPYFYYDYIRKNPKLKEKIKDSVRLNHFIEEILLKEEKICFSSEGIIEFLFTSSIDDVMTELIAQKVEDEFVDLNLLPEYYSDNYNLNFILNLESTKVHILIRWNKIKVDFNNLVYVSLCDFADDTILFAKKQLSKNGDSLIKCNIDNFAKINLESFYEFFLTEEKVDINLFESESKFLIKCGIDIIELVSPLIKKNRDISADKMHELIRLSFGRHIPNSRSNNTFCAIIKKEFDYFFENFDSIKNTCEAKASWVLNMANLLKNEYNILEEKHLNSIMNVILLDDFGDIIKEWCEEIGIYNSSKMVEKLLNEKNLDVWLDKFGEERVRGFISLNENYLDYNLEDKLYNLIKYRKHHEKNRHLIDMIAISHDYYLTEQVIIDFNSYPCVFKEVINELAKDYEPNWAKINKSVASKFEKMQFDSISNLFVLGRHFCNAIERGSVSIKDFLSKEKNILLYYSKHTSFDAFLCGAVFQSYFDYAGNLKKGTVAVGLTELQKYFEEKGNRFGRDFIDRCIKLCKD